MPTASPPVATSDHDLLSPAEAAALRVLPREKSSARAVRRLVRRGQLPAYLVVRLGRRVYVRCAAFFAWARGTGGAS